MRSLFTSLVVAGLTLAVSAPAAAAGPTVVDFVAIGDSYAAGVGAGTETGTCRVTPGAYATQWAATAPDSTELLMSACSGATAAEAVERQLAALNEDTDLVAVTIGGNDLGLVDTMRACFGDPRTAGCKTALAAIRTKLTSTLPTDTGRLLAAVRAKAPRAKLAVTGYPLPFAAVARCPQVPVDKSLRDTGTRAVRDLNTVLAAQAEIVGATFVDVTRTFTGHAQCTSAPWLVGIDGLTAQTVLHPNLDGQTSGYLAAFTAQVGSVQDVVAGIPAPDAPAPVKATGGNTLWITLAAGLLVLLGIATFLLLRRSRQAGTAVSLPRSDQAGTAVDLPRSRPAGTAGE